MSTLAIVALSSFYGLGFVLAFRAMLRNMHGFVDDRDAWGDLIMATFFSAYFAAMGTWLIVLYDQLKGRRSPISAQTVARALAGESREDKVKRLEAEAREREHEAERKRFEIARLRAENDRLERELRVGPYAVEETA